MTEHLPQLFGRVRRKRRHHDDQRVDRLAQHRDRLRPLDRADRRARRATARRARSPSLNAYSSLTSSISDDTAVFRCIRSSMST